MKCVENSGNLRNFLEWADGARLCLLIQCLNNRSLWMIQPLSVADSCRVKNRPLCTVYKGPLSQRKNASHLPSHSLFSP
jgi:hypothetical protein